MKCMKLYAGSTAYPLANVSNWSVTSSLNGSKIIQFDIPTGDKLYKYVAEEECIEYDDILYNIKSINERSQTSTVNAEIDLDSLKSRIFTEFNYTTISFAEVISYALAGTGWRVNGAGLVSAKRSFELSDVTPLDIVNKCTDKTMYNVSFDIDNKNKILNVSVPSTVSNNVYFTDQLNLKDISFKGSSSNLVTRLYAYGKDGLSISKVNSGKEYIDNNTYSDKIISAVWRDERYTSAENLLADAKEKLAELAVPERSYECSIIDLARVDPEKYSDFYIRLNSKITLIDRRRKKRLEHTVVELCEYPNEPSKNTVILSTMPQKISKRLLSNQASLNSITTEVNAYPSKWQQAIENATALITGASGGYVVLNPNPSEYPEEILIMDTPNINTAQSVWRWNRNGLGYSANGYSGPFTTAITMDGSIVADFITSGGMNAEIITTGVLQGIKIIATIGSIAGWEMNGTKLVSSGGGITLDSQGNDGLGSISIHNLIELSQLGLTFYDLNNNQIGSITRSTTGGTEHGVMIGLTDHAKDWSVSLNMMPLLIL